MIESIGGPYYRPPTGGIVMHETQQPRDPKKTTGIVYAVILVVLLLLNFWAFPAMMKGQVKQVDYGTFLNMLEGGELSTVEIQDQQIYFVDKNDTTYCTNSIAQDLQLVNRLESAGVSFGKVYNQTTWVDTLLGWVISLLPMIILIVWFNRMMRKRVGEMTGGANSMIFGGGKSGAKQYVVEDGKSIKFADVAGEDEAKESLQEIVDFLHNPKRYEDIGAKMPKGVLLVGPRAPVKPCWPALLPAKPVFPSSPLRVLNLSRCSSVWALPRCVTSSNRPTKKPPALSLLMRSIPSAKSVTVLPVWAATMNANRP